MSAASRRKGSAGELEVVHLLRAEGWPNARRTSDGREQALRGDIANGPEGCCIEVKRQEKLAVPAAFRQVQADCPDHAIPVLVHRSSRQPWLVTMRLEHLLPLLRLREQG